MGGTFAAPDKLYDDYGSKLNRTFGHNTFGNQTAAIASRATVAGASQRKRKAATKLTADDATKFEQLDKDRDGVVNWSDAKLSGMQRHTFDRLDQDKDGVIDSNDFKETQEADRAATVAKEQSRQDAIRDDVKEKVKEILRAPPQVSPQELGRAASIPLLPSAP